MSSKSKYDQWHLERDIDIAAEDIWYRRVIEHSRAHSRFEVDSVLEIGCGRGGFAIWLSRQDDCPKNLTACDFSGTAVRRGRERASELEVDGIRWREADIQDIPFSDESFDTVISCETIEHVPDPRRAVAELARVLRPGGWLFLTTPNYMNLFGLWRGYRRLIGRPFTEAGQPINNFNMIPRTKKWIKAARLELMSFGSDDLVIPRIRKHPRHLPEHWCHGRFGRNFGLQSWFVARKRP